MKWIAAGLVALLVLVIIGVGGMLVVAFVLRAWWRHGDDPRARADARDPVRRWSNGVIALYRGDIAEPGYVDAAEADAQLVGWSCPDRAALDALIERYHRGETPWPGWDIARLVFLARLGAARGDYTEAESWAHVARARATCLRSVSGWTEFADHIEAGKLDWYQNSDERDAQLRSLRAVRGWAESARLPGIPFR